MPRNRVDTAREVKVEAILDVAERLFAERGFTTTSTALLARTAGVSERTLFWYFPTKDHLLVAVTERAARGIRDELLADGAPDPGEFGDSLFRVVRAMREVRHLLPVMHQRAEVSEHVAAARARFREVHHRVIAIGLRPLGVPEDQLDAAIEIVTCFVDGVLLRNLDDRRMRQLCQALADQLRTTRHEP